MDQNLLNFILGLGKRLMEEKRKEGSNEKKYIPQKEVPTEKKKREAFVKAFGEYKESFNRSLFDTNAPVRLFTKKER